jgi:hypothetical protein
LTHCTGSVRNQLGVRFGPFVLLLLQAIAFGQTTPVLNNNYFVDGVTNTSVQSIYSQSTFAGGTITWTPAPGQNVSYLGDLFQNTTPVQAPTITITSSCSGVMTGNFLTNGTHSNLSVWQVEYDPYGNVHWSPVTQIPEQSITGGAVGSWCYTVGPATAIFGGNGTGNGAGYITLAQECTNACTPPFKPTLQENSSGTFFFDDTVHTQTYQYTTAATSPSAPFSPAFVPPPDNGGVEVKNTRIQLGGSSNTQFTILPTMIPQESQLVGLGRTTTTVQLSSSASGGIPTYALYGTLTGSGSEMTGQSRTIYAGLLENGGTVPVTISPPLTSPAFVSGFQTFTVNNPAPPYLAQTWTPNTQYIGYPVTPASAAAGQRITDPNNVPSVWVANATNITFTSQGSSPFGASNTDACISGVGAMVNDNSVTNAWKCIMHGQVLQGSSGTPHTYTAGTANGEIFDPGIASGTFIASYYEVAANCSSTVSNPQSFNPALGATTVLGSCTWVSLGGLNLVIAPGFEWFTGPTCPASMSQQNCLPIWLDTQKGVQYNFSGCAGSGKVTCPAGTSLQSSTFYGDTLSSTITLPAPSPSDAGPCVPGFNCVTAVGTYLIEYVWTTATGVSTPSGAFPKFIPANHAIRIPAPTAPTNPPPPNATGWTVVGCLGGTCFGSEILQAVDGLNNTCGISGTTLGTPAGFAPGYSHGAACALGQDMYVLSPLSLKPLPPSRGASDVMFAIGDFPHQTEEGNPLSLSALSGKGTAPSGYSSRIDALTIQMGQALNIIQPYGVGVFDPLGQEGSGIGADNSCVEVSDAAQVGVYYSSAGAQNSGSDCVHWTGANADYTIGLIVENTQAARELKNLSAMGPMQGTPFAPLAGVWIYSTSGVNVSGTSGSLLTIGNVGCEVAWDCVRVDASPAFVYNVQTSNANGRSVNNAIHLGPWAYDVFVTGIRTGAPTPPSTVNECPVFNDSPSAANPGTACATTTNATLSNYWEGNAGGVGGSGNIGGLGIQICSSDSNVGCNILGLTGNANPANLPQNAFAILGPSATAPFTSYALQPSTLAPSANNVVLVGAPSASGISAMTYGPVSNAVLSNSSTTVNGQVCTLGTSCNVNNGAASGTVAVNGLSNSPLTAGPVSADILTYHNPSTGIARTTLSSQAVSSSELSGDVTTSGSNVATVIQVEGAAIPAPAAVIGTNVSGQLLAASAHGVITPLACSDTSTSSTTYTCTTTPMFTPATGDAVMFYAVNQNNTGSSTLSVNGAVAKTIKKWQNSTNLVSGDLQANAAVLMKYDGTSWEADTIGNAPSGGTVTSISTTPPITGGPIVTSGTIACATCVTSAAVLTSNAIMTGAGSLASQTPSATSTLSSGGALQVAAGGSIGSADSGTPTFTFASGKATFNQSLYLGFAGAANAPGLIITGAPFTGGSGTTTLPQTYLNYSATNPSTWSTSGTGFGINAPSGFAGNLVDFRVNGGSTVFNVTSTGYSYSSAQTTAITSANVSCGTGGTITSCTSATTIPGLSFTLPLVAANWSFTCDLIVEQAPVGTSNQWLIQTATNGATNLTASFTMALSTTSFGYGAVPNTSSTTTPVSIGMWSPTASQKLPVHLAGTIEGVSASGTVLNIQVIVSNTSDLLTIYRGSMCRVF